MATKNDKKASRKSIITEYKDFKDTKERLQRYLNALEAKRVAAQNWMEEYTEEITIGYHNLYKAIIEKDASKAQKIIETAQKNQTAGVILTIPVDQEGGKFSTWVNATLNTQHALQDTISKTPLGIPKSIFEDVNQQYGLDDHGQAQSITASEDDTPEEVKHGFWDKITGKDVKEENALQQRIEETKKELLAVQTDQPYYIDSFFDWVESGTLQEQTEKHSQNQAVDTDDMMDQYQNPDYMLRLANNDLDETLMAYTERAHGLAKYYNAFVNAFEGLGNDSDQAKSELLLQVYKDSKKTDYFDTLKTWAFRDYNVVSFPDWAFRTFDEPKIQDTLLRNLATPGEGVKFSDAKTDEAVFNKILGATLDPQKPLSRDALAFILEDIKATSNKNPSDFTFVAGQNTIKRIVDRYRAEPKANALLLNSFLTQDIMERHEAFLVTEIFTDLLVKMDAKDAYGVLSAFQNATEECREQVMGLLYTTDPSINLTDEIYSYLKTTNGNTSNLIQKALEIGLPMPSQATITDISSHKSPYHALAHFIHTTDAMDVSAIEVIQSYIIQNTSAEMWRDILTQESGQQPSLLERAYASQTENVKTSDHTILKEILSVFEGDISKSNVLYEASETTKNPEIKKQMIEAAEILSGEFFTFNDTSIINLNKIANIWLTDSGFGYLAAGDVQQSVEARLSPEEKSEYLKALANRDELIVAGEELINPQLIDLAWVDTSDPKNVTLSIYATGTSSSISLKSAFEATQVLKAISTANPSSMQISDNVLVNKATVNHVYQENGEFNQNVIYKSSQTSGYKEDLYISTPAEDSFAKEMMSALAKENHLEKVGNHVINIDEIAMAWYDHDNEQISFILKGQPFYANDEGMLSGIPATENQAERFMTAVKERHATAYQEDGIFLNPTHVAYAYTVENNDQTTGEISECFVIYSNGTETPLPMDKTTQNNIQSYLEKTGSFMTYENAHLNLNFTSSTSPDETSQNRYIMIDDRSFIVDNAQYEAKAKKLNIGDQNNPNNIPLAGGKINFDLIHELHVYNNHSEEEALAYHCTTSPSMTTLNLPAECGSSKDVITQIKHYGQSLVKSSTQAKNLATAYRENEKNIKEIANDVLAKPAVLQEKPTYSKSISDVFAQAAKQVQAATEQNTSQSKSEAHTTHQSKKRVRR